MKTLFTYLPFAFFLLTMWTFVLPLTRHPRAQAISAMALLVCFSKFLCFGAFGGDAFAPELPAAVIRIWCVLYSSVTILLGLTVLWWTVFFLLRTVRVRLPRRALLALPFAAAALAVWGVWNGLRAPDVREIELAYEDLPEGLDGYRIVQISDLHASASAREDRTAEIVARANALAPDLVCLTGDYADGRPGTWKRLLPLKDLRAKDGVLAVTGNHEYYNDWGGWRDRLAGEVGLRFLENDCAFPRKDLAVGGVNDYAVERFGGGRFPWVGTAFAAATNGEFRILLQHQPRQADANCEAWDVRLQLSGHTHGGVMPLMDRLVAKANNGFVRGAYRLGRSWLYVSPGCGQWAGFPVRYFNPTEVTLIRLVRRPAAVVAACRASGADTETERRRRFMADATKPGATLGNVAKMVNVWNARACGLSTATNRQDYDIFEFVEWIELMQCTGGNDQRDLFRDPSDRSTKDDYDFVPIIDVIRGVRRLGAKPYLKLGNVPQKFTDGFDSGEFAINTRPPDDWDAHYRYMRAFASALVRAFGRDEVRSWRFALLTEADNRGWFRAKSGSDEDSFAAYCRLYRETYRAFAEVLGNGFVYGTHVLGEGYGWKRWTADQFCSFCAREKLPLDIIALSFYDTAGKSPRAQRLEDQVIGAWRTAAAAHGFGKVIWGYDEGRIIVGAKGRDKDDIAPRAVGDTYQAAYDARLTKNLFDLGVDYFSNWDYFAGENPVLEGIPAVTFHVAREVAKFKGMQRVPFALNASEGADELEESDGVAAVSADGSLLRMMVYNFRNQLAYVRPSEASITVKTAFPAGTRVRIVRRTVDDAVNWFDDWERDRQAKGIRNEDYGWSPDGYCLLSRTGLIKPEHRDFFKAQLPRYAEMVKLVPEAEDATVAADGTVRMSARLSGNAVAFFEVR